MKIISKKYLPRHEKLLARYGKNFVEQISMKFAGFFYFEPP